MSRSIRIALAAATCALAGAVSAPAFAGDPSQTSVTIIKGNSGSGSTQLQAGSTYRVTARVPVACWVRPSGTVLVGNGLGGSVVEACNSPGGFTVSASYRPLTLTEKAHMFYGGSKLDLAKSGQQVLRRSNMATIRTVDYRFEDVELEAPLVLFLTIQPI